MAAFKVKTPHSTSRTRQPSRALSNAMIFTQFIDGMLRVMNVVVSHLVLNQKISLNQEITPLLISVPHNLSLISFVELRKGKVDRSENVLLLPSIYVSLQLAGGAAQAEVICQKVLTHGTLQTQTSTAETLKTGINVTSPLFWTFPKDHL